MTAVAAVALPELDEIEDALTVDLVVGRIGMEVRRPSHGWWYGHQCAVATHSKSGRGFAIDPEAGMWTCHACGTKGNLLGLIAAHLNLTTRGADFVRVMAVAAEWAGVTAANLTPEERDLRRAQRREAQEQRRREDAEKRAWDRAYSIPKATAYWDGLDTRNVHGESYLRTRGLLAAVLRGLVRFDRAGDWPAHDSIALAVRTADGQIANVKRRRLPAWIEDPKVDRFRPLPGLYPHGTYIGAITEIGPGRDVLLTEGFADAITAALAWPSAVIIGAQSSSDLAEMAQHAAPRVAEVGGRMLIAPHNDDSGYRAALRACDAALDAGLRTKSGTLVIVEHGADDLNDAWCQGWRP